MEFREKPPNVSIGYSKFSELLPRHSVLPGVRWTNTRRRQRLPPRLTSWKWPHTSRHGLLEGASVLLWFRPWRCSEVKRYSCRRWTQRAVCPSRFLKFMSQVSAEWYGPQAKLGIVLMSSRWPVVSTGWGNNFPLPYWEMKTRQEKSKATTKIGQE
jgi:hypothetical protein